MSSTSISQSFDIPRNIQNDSRPTVLSYLHVSCSSGKFSRHEGTCRALQKPSGNVLTIHTFIQWKCVQGERGDVVVEGCIMLTCAKKGKGVD